MLCAGRHCNWRGRGEHLCFGWRPRRACCRLRGAQSTSDKWGCGLLGMLPMLSRCLVYVPLPACPPPCVPPRAPAAAVFCSSYSCGKGTAVVLLHTAEHLAMAAIFKACKANRLQWYLGPPEEDKQPDSLEAVGKLKVPDLPLERLKGEGGAA